MSASLTPNISKFGEEFDARKSSQYRLTIQFALDGLSYALLDTENHRLIALESYQSDLLTESNNLFRCSEQALESKGLNNKVFHSVSCIVDNRTNTLVPIPFFNETDQEQYLDFVFQRSNLQTVQANRLDTVGCYNVFAWSKSLKDKVLSKWKHAEIIHSTSVFINNVMKHTDDQGVFVNVRNADFDMVIKKEGKLQFFNNFRFNTKDDFAYFLLFAMEQNGLSGQNISVTFSGLILPSSEIIGLCKRYVREIRFAEDPHTIQVSPILNDVPFHYYFIHYQALR